MRVGVFVFLMSVFQIDLLLFIYCNIKYRFDVFKFFTGKLKQKIIKKKQILV